MRARVLLRLYPMTWRMRYGEELEGLLGSQALTFNLTLDLLRGALDARLHPDVAQPRLVSAGGSHPHFAILGHPSALVPIAMSLAALALVLGHIAMVGTARQADEGTEAHLWQLLMAGQLPIIALFAITSLPRAPRRTLWVLALQSSAALAAAAPVFILRW